MAKVSFTRTLVSLLKSSFFENRRNFYPDVLIHSFLRERVNSLNDENFVHRISKKRSKICNHFLHTIMYKMVALNDSSVVLEKYLWKYFGSFEYLLFYFQILG